MSGSTVALLLDAGGGATFTFALPAAGSEAGLTLTPALVSDALIVTARFLPGG